ncbi:MAG: serine hydrolase [Bacteroidota bacterium]
MVNKRHFFKTIYNYLRYFLLFSVIVLICSCSTNVSQKNLLEAALSSDNPKIRTVMDSVKNYAVQIRYTQIDRRNDSILLTDFDFQVDKDNYFYPASTVKFPIAVLALEKLNHIDSLSRDVKFYIEGDSIENTFAEDVVKIFAVSDNHANNRLLEFLGQDTINLNLRNKGIDPVRISHRLGFHSDALTTKPLILYMNDSTLATTTSIMNTEPKALELESIKKGRGYYAEDSLYMEPFDFSLKNYYPIKAQHAVLKRIVFPENFGEEEQFRLSEDQRSFLLDAMKILPKEAGYDPKDYYDGYCKFFLYGDTEDVIPDHIKIYNKVGFAYGTLTDCAYIVDSRNEVEFMVTATILVNKDGIFNDDAYEYDEIGIPFLAELGRQLHQLELERRGKG